MTKIYEIKKNCNIYSTRCRFYSHTEEQFIAQNDDLRCLWKNILTNLGQTGIGGQPSTGVSQNGFGGGQPGVGGRQTGSDGRQPGSTSIGGGQPGSGGRVPGSGGEQPGSGTNGYGSSGYPSSRPDSGNELVLKSSKLKNFII